MGGEAVQKIDNVVMNVNVTLECPEEEEDVDIRRDLYTNTVLSGGTTMFPNIDVRPSVSTRCGLAAPSCPRCRPSRRCGSPRTSTMRADRALCTVSASKESGCGCI